MRVDWMIARKLRLADNGSRRSAMSVRISVAGVALSMTIMLLTIAIVSGFKHEITRKLMGFESQIAVTATSSTLERETPVTLDNGLRSIIADALPGAHVATSIFQPAMLKTTDDFEAVVMRGYDDDYDWSFISNNITEGSTEGIRHPASGASPTPLAISQVTASTLGLKAGDRLTAAFFVDGRMRLRPMVVEAIYNSGFSDYDRTVAYAPAEMLRRLRGIADGQASRIEIDGLDLENLDRSQGILQEALAAAYYSGVTSDWLSATSVRQTGAIYFNWLDLLDTNVVVIIVLMSLISVFTLVASLLIITLERVNTIGTLKTIGASDGMIRRVMIILVSKILCRGLIAGNLIGLTFIAVQSWIHLIPLDPEAYYISFVPVRIALWQIVALNAGAIAVAIAAMIGPSMVAARMDPSRSVRFE